MRRPKHVKVPSLTNEERDNLKLIHDRLISHANTLYQMAFNWISIGLTLISVGLAIAGLGLTLALASIGFSLELVIVLIVVVILILILGILFSRQAIKFYRISLSVYNKAEAVEKKLNVIATYENHIGKVESKEVTWCSILRILISAKKIESSIDEESPQTQKQTPPS